MNRTDKVFQRLQSHLSTDETVLEEDGILLVVVGSYETKRMGNDAIRKGSLIATNQRLIFFASKLTGFELESFPYSAISSIEQGKNMMGANLKIIASGNTAFVKWIDDPRACSYLVNKTREMIASSKKLGTASEGLGIDIPDQIKKLSDLKDLGVLTDEEFNQKKQDLLDRL